METIFSFVILIAASTSVFAQTKNTSAVTQIESYARSIDKITNRRKEPDLVIADVSDYETEKPEWRKFRSTKELDAFRETTETYTVAHNWKTNGKIVSSVFTFFSPSGDWAQCVTHYFRPNGTAAKVNTEMRTFNGDYIIIREKYFDASGKLLKQTAKYLDLATKKPKKPTAEMLDENSDFFKAEYYKKVSSLPFYSLTL
jgi:hypothetical protein